MILSRALRLSGRQSVPVVRAFTTSRIGEVVNPENRALSGDYDGFVSAVRSVLPADRVLVDPLQTLAFSSDASCYRLVPKAVLRIHNEAEVAQIMPLATKFRTPVTFRAAGTSLSGQAVTDSVLLKISGTDFRRYKVEDGGNTFSTGPGLILGECNRILAKHGKKLGPDPASIESCWVGGVVANNSSGMCCGTHSNSYNTVKDMRVVFADGSILDTSDPKSWEAYQREHQPRIQKLMNLVARVNADPELTSLIRRKFSIKCTTGYSINALVDFESPLEIIKHLMIGSEGTLGFVSRVTFRTVPEWSNKASAFMFFPNMHSACDAARVLRSSGSVDAAELFDYSSIVACKQVDEVRFLKLDTLPLGSAGLLVEVRGQDVKSLNQRIERTSEAIRGLPLARELKFETDPAITDAFWYARKVLIPLLGKSRKVGTTLITEDVAVPIENLAPMCTDLLDLFRSQNYDDAILFGHALDGNMHILFSQGFDTPQDVHTYGVVMKEMAEIVAKKYGGSLKAEHGTGRNMAPFVEMEWGRRAYEVMWELKRIFDPDNVVNPGVILNNDDVIHLKNLKPMQASHELIDSCIECGFCESTCPSREITLTPRQRIVVMREMSRLNRAGDEVTGSTPNTAKQDSALLSDKFEYSGNATCAADGMCGEKCPVKINTGYMIKNLRTISAHEDASGQRWANWLVRNYAGTLSAGRKMLSLASSVHSVVGNSFMQRLADIAFRLSPKGSMAKWNPYFPRAASSIPNAWRTELSDLLATSTAAKSGDRRVVYFPSCMARTMGPARGDNDEPIFDHLDSLLRKAGFQVIVPSSIDGLCCGLSFHSRGFLKQDLDKAVELQVALLRYSDNGKIPILCETSPCLMHIRDTINDPRIKLNAYEPFQFVEQFVTPHLQFVKKEKSIALHIPCSSSKMKVNKYAESLARRCSEEVSNTSIPCCGMAGDRGMRYPELTDASLQFLDLPSSCSEGVSSSRACEMSLSAHSGIHFRSVVSLVDRCTVAKASATKSV